MNIKIYDEKMNLTAIIGGRFVSCLWSEGYNTVQPFTLELQDTESVRGKIRQDGFVTRDDRKTAMVIRSVNFSDGKIVISGKEEKQLIDDTVFIGTISEGAMLDDALYHAYSESNPVPLVSVRKSGIDIKTASQMSNKTMLELYTQFCKETEVGFRGVKSDGGIAVELYKPEPNPNLIFSQKFGNMKLEKIMFGNEGFKNYAIVLGEGEGSARRRVDVDLSGDDRPREMVVDARDLQKEESESNSAYLARLRERGVEKLIEKKRVFEVAISPGAGDFGVRYDLGDVLTIPLPEYGLKFNARVTRFTQKCQNNKTTTTVEVGLIL